jgi:hypothetical protein
MINILQQNNCVFYVFMGTFPGIPRYHISMPWIESPEKSLDDHVEERGVWMK